MFVEEKAKGEGPEYDYGRPSISNLAYVLRHPTEWPQGFEWDYGSSCSCALGMAHRLWPEQIPSDSVCCVSDVLGLSREDGTRIFLDGNPLFIGFGIRFDIRTKPRQIAKALEKVAAKQPRSPSTVWLRHPANVE